MKSILIIGAGGHGRVVAEIAEDLGYERIGFLDDNSETAIGKLKDMEQFTEYGEAVCGIGNNTVRKQVLDRLEGVGYKIPCLIHPSAYISRSAVIEKGVVIEPGAVVNANSHIGYGSIISVGAIVDHDTVIGVCAHINAGAIVKAGAKVADYTRMDAGCVVNGY